MDNLIFWEISDLSYKGHGRQNAESYYYIQKMGGMQACDKSMPSRNHAETLKETCSYDRALYFMASLIAVPT